jgi:Flp pilus assembly protein TadG
MIGAPGLREEKGQTAVEFALVLPLICVLLLGVIQFGITFNNYETLTDATRVGARKAITSRLAGGSTTDAVQAVENAAADLDVSQLDVTVTSPNWTQAGSDVVVTAKYPYAISLLGWVVASGDLTTTITERME